MAKTELKLKTKNAGTGQNITTTVSYVNPNADSNTLKTFGQKLNNLTTNNYVETDRVQTINVDTEEVVIPKKDQTIQLSNWTTRSTPDTTAYNVATVQAEGVIAISAKFVNGGVVKAGIGAGSGSESVFGAGEVYVQKYNSDIGVTIVASGNDEYNGSSLTTTITQG